MAAVMENLVCVTLNNGVTMPTSGYAVPSQVGFIIVYYVFYLLWYDTQRIESDRTCKAVMYMHVLISILTCVNCVISMIRVILYKYIHSQNISMIRSNI